MTEKQYAPTKTEKKMTQKVEAPKEVKAPVKEDKKTEVKKDETKTEAPAEDKKKKTTPKIKKDFAIVNVRSFPVSTKYAISICRFIRGKNIGDAIRDLEAVVQKKKAVPMKGEYAHKKGVSIASGAGKYPVDAGKKFIMLLKSLSSNTIANSMDNPYISEAIANKAPEQRARFGRWTRKRTHVYLKASERKVKKVREEKK